MRMIPDEDIAAMPRSIVSEQGDAVFYEVNNGAAEDGGDLRRTKEPVQERAHPMGSSPEQELAWPGQLREQRLDQPGQLREQRMAQPGQLREQRLDQPGQLREQRLDQPGQLREKGKAAEPEMLVVQEAQDIPLSFGAYGQSQRAHKLRAGYGRYVWLLIFAAGLTAGTLFMNTAADTWANLSGDWMEELTGKVLDFDGNVETFIRILLKRGGIFIFLAGITLLWRRSLLLYLSTAYFGFCFGVVISSAAVSYGPSGLLMLLQLLLPHYMLYIPAFICLARQADKINAFRKNRAKNGSRQAGRRLVWRETAAAFLLAALLTAAGCVLECYVNPIWIKFFSNI